jgi:SAM-dependent methyltransferase
MRTEGFGGVVGFCRIFLQRVVAPGDRVVDATCGRGRDALFLAQLVGSSGKVWAFDVQEEALAEARNLLGDAGCLPWVTLVASGHEAMVDHVPTGVRAVVFNLGYLPGNEAGVVTQPHTTRAALNQAAALLAPGGIIAIAVYTGHGGGGEEACAVAEWAAALPSRTFNAWKCCHLNRSSSAPHVLVVEKLL